MQSRRLIKKKKKKRERLKIRSLYLALNTRNTTAHRQTESACFIGLDMPSRVKLLTLSSGQRQKFRPSHTFGYLYRDSETRGWMHRALSTIDYRASMWTVP